nr:MAG TPA: hypothetical protein [Caudoviricetes sp.]
MQLVEKYGTKRLIFAFNHYKVWANDEPCEIHTMQEFNNYNRDLGHEPLEIAGMVFSGEFNPYDRYFTIDGYGNYKSLSGMRLLQYIADEVDTDDKGYILQMCKRL